MQTKPTSMAENAPGQSTGQANGNGVVRIAAVGDIHVRENDKGKWTDYFKEVSRHAVLCVNRRQNNKAEEREDISFHDEKLSETNIGMEFSLLHDAPGGQCREQVKM